MLIYYYSFGDLNILGSEITIYKNKNVEHDGKIYRDLYEIIFIQEGFVEYSKFRDINSKFRILSKTVNDDFDENLMNVRTIKMKVYDTYNNPPPEKLFEFDHE